MTDPFLDSSEPLAPGDAVAALIVAEDGRYLLQLRDSLAGIFYPGHWGLFGGAIEPGESDLAALCRELLEELGLAARKPRYFTRFDFDLGFAGRAAIRRVFYEVRLEPSQIAKLKLREGASWRLVHAREALATLRLVPYDAFALWLHASRTRLGART